MSKKFVIDDERFLSEKPIPLYKRATGVHMAPKEQEDEEVDFIPAIEETQEKMVDESPVIKEDSKANKIKRKSIEKKLKGPHMTSFTVRVERAHMMQLKKIYAATGKNVSQMISDAVADYIKKENVSTPTTSKDKTKIVSAVVRINKDLLHDLKAYAFHSDVFYSDVVRNALDVFLAKNNAK